MVTKYKLCILTTVSTSLKLFYRGQFDALHKAGFNTTVVCAADESPRDVLPDETDFVNIRFTRLLTPLVDLQVLWKLYKLFVKRRFDIVQYSTYKASLLASVAAYLAHTPIRIYILWGLYYTGQKGVKKYVFRLLDKLICNLSTDILPIAHDMIAFALSEGLGTKSKYNVIHNGSACGIDLQEYNPERWPNARSTIRVKYNIPPDAVVVGSTARLTGDKGINELVEAFSEISKEFSNVHLLIVGGQEEKDKLKTHVCEIIKDNPRIHAVGWQEDPRPFYVAMDIFCLPTYREGFGEVNLEAQAMCLPVVSTNVIGPRESIQDNITGFLVEPRSSKALMVPLKKLVLDADLRIVMGRKGRQRVERMFNRADLIRKMVAHRLSLVAATHRLSRPVG